MIDLDLFLQELLIQGVELWIEGERLQVRPPQGGLSPEKLALLSQYESEIVRLLPTFSFDMPLSYGQEALWVVHENTPNKAAYNIAMVLHLKNGVDKALLCNVLQKIVRRHSALRTTIVASSNGKPKQVIHATQALSFEKVDCSGQSMSGGTRDQEMVMQAVEEAYQRPFELSEGPLWRATLVTQSPDSHALLLSFHHIIIDGSSLWMLLDEFLALYAAGRARRVVNLPPITSTYAQFVQWQREMLDTHGERLRAYWQEALGGKLPVGGELPVLDLPTDHPRPKVTTYQTGKLPFCLSSDLTDELRALARREEVSFYTVLLAAFQILLARYQQGAERVLVGVPTAGREREEFAQTFGYFVNPVVVDATLTNVPFISCPAGTSFLSQVQAKLLAAIEHKAYPFPWLVKDLQIEREANRGPIFQAMLVVQQPQKLAEETVRLLRGEQVQLATANDVPDLLLEVEGWMQTVGQLDIIFDLSEQTTPRGLEGHIRYKKDIFEATTIERMGQHYQQLLEAIVRDATPGIYQLPLLTERERHQLLVEWNDTATDYAPDKCIHELFAEQAARTPDAIAVVFPAQFRGSLRTGEDSLTYRALNRKANQLAHHLQSLGVGPEVLVGITVERSLEIVIGILGILKAGGAYVPLDPTYPQERLAFMLQDANVSVLLTQEELLGNLPPTTAQVLCLDQDWSEIAGPHDENISIQLKPDNLAYVIYTSGSTGQPKGVLVQHDNVVRLFRATEKWFHFNESDVWTLFHSYAFDFSVWEIWGALLYGGRLVVVPYWVSRSPESFYQLLCEQGVTVLNQTPSAFMQLVNLKEAVTDPEALALRYVIFGGEALEFASLQPWFDRHGDSEPQLINMYGITETTVHVTYRPVTQADVMQLVSLIGEPIPDLQLYVLDAHQQLVPIGVRGELYVGGAGVSRGYLNRPALTAERFTQIDSISFGGQRLYRTGDLVRRLANGDIEYMGRIDNQVKIRGFRIELGEIESVLRQHPTVRQSVVVAREERAEKELVAYIVPLETGTFQIPPLRTHIKQILPDYMVPGAFVTLDALPLTPNGKINRKALPTPTIRSNQESYVRPQSPTEEVLAAIWAEVLGLERVGREDNFFEIGGHSLLATQVISRLRQAFGVELAVQIVFEAPTIEQLAKAIQSARQVTLPVRPSIAARSRSGDVCDLPLSFAQQRLWFLDQLEGASATYNIPAAFRLSGTLQVAALQEAIHEIIHRHEILRTTFPTVGEQPVQRITPASLTGAPGLVVVELKHLYETEQRDINRLLADEAAQPFDLAKGPLLRVILYQLSQSEHVLQVTMHHIISDGWSMGLWWQELSRLYRAFATGDSSPLPELSLQYADFAQWQREWLQGEVLEKQLAYWQAQLADAPTLLELPTDFPRPFRQSTAGQVELFDFSPTIVEPLRALSRRSGTSLFMTLYGAFSVLMSRYSGQEDIVIGSPIANRHYLLIEPLIGFFVNTLALRTDLSGNPSFLELLLRVRQATLDAYSHQDIPFEQLVHELAVQRHLSHSPLFQVMFTWLDLPQPVALGELKMSPLFLQTATAKFDLTLSLAESERGGLQGIFEYNTDLFQEDTIRRMVGHLQSLLQAVGADPEQPIKSLPLLTEAERHQILVEWNDTATDYASDKCIHELFAEQAERTPDAIAVVFPAQFHGRHRTGEDSLTYRALNHKANQLAHHLQSLGVGPETLVGICIERSLEMVVGLLGILKAGAAYLPLDPDYPQTRIAYMLSDAQVPVLLTQHKFVERLSEQLVKLVCLDDDWQSIATFRSDTPIVHVKPNNLAYVIYTSGSTGKPKGVLVPHLAINRLVNNTNYIDIVASDRIGQASNASFDAATFEIWGALLHGAQLVGISREVTLSPQRLATELREKQISILFLTTALFNQVISLVPDAFESLRYLLFGGEEVNPSYVKKCLSDGPPENFLHVYGPTENTTFSSWYHIQGKPSGTTTIPIGIPIANSQIYIVDKQLQPVPIGVPGELLVGGDGLARGYLNRPKLTFEAFIANPFGAGKLYKTGDLARYLPDGNIEFIGRIDKQVKLRGFRIELGEIESALTQHAAVQQAVVVLHRSIREEQLERKELVAYIVEAESREQDREGLISALRRHLLQTLPDYMVPTPFVFLERLPLNPNGKVDHKALPAPERAGDESRYIPPRTPTEETLTTIWAEVLGATRVGIHDNFFDLGGHSLLATQVISRMAKAFGLDLPVRALFENPTIAELAERIKNAQLVLAFQGMSRDRRDQSATFSKDSSPEMARQEEEEEEEEFVL